jgi:hypothetical protein
MDGTTGLVRVVDRGPGRRGDGPLTILYDMNAYAEENMRRPLDIEMAFSAGEGI